MYLHYFVIISPWKRSGPFVWTNLYPFHPRISMFCVSLVEIGLVVLEKKMKMWKVYRQTTDDRYSEKLTWAFSSTDKTGANYLEIEHECVVYLYTCTMTLCPFNMNWESHWIIIKSLHKVTSLIILLQQSSAIFKNYRIFFIQIVFWMKRRIVPVSPSNRTHNRKFILLWQI